MQHLLLTAALKQASIDKIERYVTGGIILFQGKVLIVQRAATEDYLPSLWELPGGHADDGEDIVTGFKREIVEETNLTNLDIKCLANTFDYRSRSGKRVRQFNFLAETVDNNVRLSPAEHQAFAWISPTLIDLKSYNMSDIVKASIILAFEARA